MSIYSSIYIPRMSVDHTEESITYYMAHYNIGTVSHIDFTPINKKPGFKENVNEVVKSAFVHFSDPWFCSDKLYHFQCRTFMGNTKFWETIASKQSYKLQVSDNEYWLCLKNKNPVQRTMMNIHQVVENGRHLEGLIEAHAKTIQEQADRIEVLERKLEGTHKVVYQLLGGLFNQSDQCGILNHHVDILMCKEDGTSFKDISKWKNWPTTRQGDECETRIERLEKIIMEDNENNDEYERKIYDEYMRLARVSEGMELEMNEYENHDEKREYCKKSIGLIQSQKITIQKMYENKTGLPWSYLLNKISFRR